MRSLVLAHRGAPSGEGPENSLAAFRELSSLGVDGVELDVQVTVDGLPVVAHDPTIGGRRIEELRYPEVLELQGADLSAEHRIPTLDDVLRVLPDHFLVNLEIKAEQAGPSLIEAIDGAHSRYRVVVTSFDAKPLIALRRAAPEIRTGLVSGVRVANLLARVREALADVVSLQWKLATPEVVRDMHDNGVAVYVWTVNRPDTAVRMAELGVDAIITDDPGTMVPLLGTVPSPSTGPAPRSPAHA